MNNINFSISFGRSRKSEYTPHQIKVMRDMKKAAIENKWCDIYTGKPFTKTNLPTIEHIIAHSLKQSDRVINMSKEGFELDGFDNIFPVGSLGNSTGSNKKFAKRIVEEPKILNRLLTEFNKYKQYKSDLIDGKTWVDKLHKTFSQELTGLCSDVKNKKLRIQL